MIDRQGSLTKMSERKALSRRCFLGAASAGLGVLKLGHPTLSKQSVRRDAEFGSPLREFSYGQIQLAPGLHETQLHQTITVLMGLDEDSLLKPMRLAAGQPAPGADLGGWYNRSSGGGSTFGQWLSGLARYHAITGDRAVQEKVTRLVDAFGRSVEPTGQFYAQKPYGNSYTYDKIVCGLIDTHQFTRTPRALRILSLVTQAAMTQLPGRAVDTPVLNEGDVRESYTLPENQFIAWQRGGDARHLHLARQYMADRAFFEPLARGENVLPNRHAYSHVNALSSAAKAYLVLGSPMHLLAAEHGFDFLSKQSFVTGGWGPYEALLPSTASHIHVDDTEKLPAGTDVSFETPAISDVGDSISKSRWSFETPCGSYAHFKLTRYLLRITQDPKYGDSMERVMYNTVLGALPLRSDGRAFYYSDYSNGAKKGYLDDYNSDPNVMRVSHGSLTDEQVALWSRWPCCSGTLAQVACDYRISTYLYDSDGIFVSLYIPSTVRWRQFGTGVELKQFGEYPVEESMVIAVTLSRSVQFSIRLRVPAWALSPVIRVNGRVWSGPVIPGTFAVLSREWHSGDRIELEFPRALRLEAVDARHPNLVALVYGPLVLFAVGNLTAALTRADLMSAQRNKGASEWHVRTDQGRVRFVPFWRLTSEEPYTTYHAI